MKTLTLLLCFLACTGLLCAQTPGGPVTLYISKQTGEKTVFSGSDSKTADKHEYGTITITQYGPIQHSVSPAQMYIGPKQTRTWDGKIWGDVGAGPSPGSSAPATITGVYKVSYSRPCPTCPSGHEMVEDLAGAVTLSFEVVSINVEAPDTVNICPDEEASIGVDVYPGGGKCQYTAGAGIQILRQAENFVAIKVTGKSDSRVTAKYIIDGVSFSKEIYIRVGGKKPEVSVPDTVVVPTKETGHITATGLPGGGEYEWTVSSGLGLLTSTQDQPTVAFTAGRKAGLYSATVVYTLCGQEVTKTVAVKVTDCYVNVVPDSTVVMKGKTGTLVATGGADRSVSTFQWSGGGVYSFEGPTNLSSVDIKGLQKGISSISVNYQAPGCTLTKTVGVRVVDTPTLTISPLSSSGILCMGMNYKFKAIVYPGPATGNYAWSIEGPAQIAGAGDEVVVQPSGGGDCKLICTYSEGGVSVTASLTFKTREIIRVDITEAPGVIDTVSNTETITYMARAFDHNNVDVTAECTFDWSRLAFIYGGEGPSGLHTYPELINSGAMQTFQWRFESAPGVVVPPGAVMSGSVKAQVSNCNPRTGWKDVRVKQ